MLFTPSWFSILAMMRMLELCSSSRWRISIMSWALRTKLTQIKSKPCLDAKQNIIRSRWLIYGMDRCTPGTLTPFLVLMVPPFCTVQMMSVSLTVSYLQLDQAVVQHDGTARLHVHGQILVGDRADLVGALHIAGGQGELLACNQLLNAVLEVLRRISGPFGVQQCSYGLDPAPRAEPSACQSALVLLVGAVGKIETGNVHAIVDQMAQHTFLIGGRAKGTNNFRLSHAIYLRQLSLTYIRHSTPAGCCV